MKTILTLLLLIPSLSWGDENFKSEHLDTLCENLVDTTIASIITKSANIYDEIKSIKNLSSSEKQEKLLDILELGEVSDKLTDQLYKYSVIYQNICAKTDLKKELYSLD